MCTKSEAIARTCNVTSFKKTRPKIWKGTCQGVYRGFPWTALLFFLFLCGVLFLCESTCCTHNKKRFRPGVNLAGSWESLPVPGMAIFSECSWAFWLIICCRVLLEVTSGPQINHFLIVPFWANDSVLLSSPLEPCVHWSTILQLIIWEKLFLLWILRGEGPVRCREQQKVHFSVNLFNKDSLCRCEGDLFTFELLKCL